MQRQRPAGDGDRGLLDDDAVGDDLPAEGRLHLHRNGGSGVLDAQVICDEFEMGGNGDVSITYEPDKAVKLNGIGLVQ